MTTEALREALEIGLRLARDEANEFRQIVASRPELYFVACAEAAEANVAKIETAIALLGAEPARFNPEVDPLYYVTRWTLTGKHAVCELATSRVVLDLDAALADR